MLSDSARRIAALASLSGAVLLAVTLAMLFVTTGSGPRRTAPRPVHPSTAVPIEKSYPGKIVYAIGGSGDSTRFVLDCQGRGGTFNRCGSICPPGTEVCAEICAYTCEFGKTGASVTLPDQCSHVPIFAEFPSGEPYRGSVAKVNFASNPAAREFRTAITEGAAAGPNFAGRYTVTSWGCGTTCQDHAIVDAATGTIVQFGLPSFYDLSYRLDSNLLVVNPSANVPPDTEQRITTEYYSMHDGKLDFSCRLPVPSPVAYPDAPL